MFNPTIGLILGTLLFFLLCSIPSLTRAKVEKAERRVVRVYNQHGFAEYRVVNGRKVFIRKVQY